MARNLASTTFVPGAPSFRGLGERVGTTNLTDKTANLSGRVVYFSLPIQHNLRYNGTGLYHGVTLSATFRDGHHAEQSLVECQSAMYRGSAGL
jgi:hypothetical protein